MKRITYILLIVLVLTAAYVYAWPAANVPYFGAIILHLLAGVAFLALLIFTLRSILREGPTASRVGWLLLVLGGILGALLIYTARGARSGRCCMYTSALASGVVHYSFRAGVAGTAFLQAASRAALFAAHCVWWPQR
jgi:hypothetical protein